MSMWSYVRGLIEIDVPGRTQAEKDYILQTTIAHLPKVTGSEGDMDIHAIKRFGYNEWSNRDELDNPVQDFRTQSQYFLVLDGSLRNRYYEDTFKELNNFLNRLAKRLMVDSVYVNLNDFNHSYMFTNENDCYRNMFEFENPWYLYLRWNWDDECF